ncbi:hypothetical protein EXIGLDRAFT_767317 [Exidia glandulosa HHB12029]|uniref:DUF829-domain-containing protein n=1 Tax=Exidia glandulosa HHB12029 TaxID=1314781 RepID=A0A165J2Y5_EXIGL|nr:hypothetical protein EXIGLDRAFT_767317 [Exidia glandulosa HHB12029]
MSTSTRTVLRVNSRVSILKPLVTPESLITENVDVDGPSVILICGWMDAKFGTLLKYSQAYDKLFPHATHIILEQNMGGFWMPRSMREKELAPVADLLVHSGIDWANPSTSRGLIVHTFSNGGCFRLVQLIGLIRKLHPSPQRLEGPLPPTAMIFDSCPGRASLILVHRAMAASISNPILKALFTLFFVPAYGVRWVINALLRRPDPIEAVRREFARADVLPWTTACTPRVFVYSPRDAMVMPEDVEAHAASLVEKGLTAKLEKFATSAHVAHARVEPERYWGIVRDAWEAAKNTAA